MSEWFWIGIEARYYGYCVGELLIMLALSHVAPTPDAVRELYRGAWIMEGNREIERQF